MRYNKTYLVITPTAAVEFFCRFRAAEYAARVGGRVKGGAM